MRKYLFLFLLVVGALTAAAKDIREYVVTTVPQMSCQNCEKRIKGNMRFEKGVKNVVTDLANQRVTVTYDAEKTDEKKLEEAFGKLNYKVTKIDDCDDSANCPNQKSECSGNHSNCKGDKKDCCKDKQDSNKKDCCKDKKDCDKKDCCKNKNASDKKDCCSSEIKNVGIGYGDKKK